MMAKPGWNLYKAEIERLYIQENKTREEVMSFMTTHHSWNKSGAQYSKKFKEWGLRKHSCSRDDQWIAHRIEKRKREEKKDSEVFIDGVQIHPSKIAKSSYRKGFLTEHSRHGAPPSTPEGYVVATPVTPGLHISWTASLPWIRFMHLLQPAQSGGVPPFSSVPPLVLNMSRGGNTARSGININLMKGLIEIISWDKLKHPRKMHSASRTSAALRILMPESEPDQHDILSADLSTSSSGTWGHSGIFLYLISNNLIPQLPNTSFFEPIKQYFEMPTLNDELILRIIKEAGWDDLNHFKILLSSREPTAESITERLFAAALHESDFEIVQKMLLSGINPNQLIKFRLGAAALTPLQLVSGNGKSADLINLLIFHGADINFSMSDNGETALYCAIEKANETSIRVLLSHGAVVTKECAREAITALTPTLPRRCTACATTLNTIAVLYEDIIEIYLNQDVAMQRDDTETLRWAVLAENKPMIERFLAKGANLHGLSRLALREGLGHGMYQTTLLGIAVERGRIDIVRLLLHLSTREVRNHIWPPYISPLAIAAERGFIDAIRLLLSWGADIRDADEGEKTLLERAVPMQNLSVCQTLIIQGAKVDREPQYEPQWRPSALMLAVQRSLLDIIDLLISSNARLNDHFDVGLGPRSILAAAIEAGNVVIINKLVNAGARLIEPEIRRIGNLQTAIFLQENRYLASFLHRAGSQLLTAAISAGDDDLSWFLLVNNADKEGKQAIHRGKTPLWAALRENKSVLVLSLLARGADVTDDALTEAINNNVGLLPTLLIGFAGSAPTAVAAALLKHSMASLQWLREGNVNMGGEPQMMRHCWDVKGLFNIDRCRLQSVLEIAAWKADIVMFRYLLEWASSVHMNWSPRSVARALTIAILNRKLDHVSELMKFEVDPDCDITNDSSAPFGRELELTEYSSYSPLQAAVKCQLVSLVRDLLVSKGADVNHLGEGELRRTPLQHAVELGNMEIFNLLIENGADVNGPPAEDCGATALQIAAIKGYIGIARRLIDLGADVNQEPALENGRTALMGAAEYGRIDMLQMLLDEGALVVGEHEDDYHEAVWLAESEGHYAAARLLKSFKASVEACMV